MNSININKKKNNIELKKNLGYVNIKKKIAKVENLNKLENMKLNFMNKVNEKFFIKKNKNYFSKFTTSGYYAQKINLEDINYNYTKYSKKIHKRINFYRNFIKKMKIKIKKNKKLFKSKKKNPLYHFFELKKKSYTPKLMIYIISTKNNTFLVAMKKRLKFTKKTETQIFKKYKLRKFRLKFKQFFKKSFKKNKKKYIKLYNIQKLKKDYIKLINELSHLSLKKNKSLKKYLLLLLLKTSFSKIMLNLKNKKGVYKNIANYNNLKLNLLKTFLTNVLNLNGTKKIKQVFTDLYKNNRFNMVLNHILKKKNKKIINKDEELKKSLGNFLFSKYKEGLEKKDKKFFKKLSKSNSKMMKYIDKYFVSIEKTNHLKKHGHVLKKLKLSYLNKLKKHRLKKKIYNKLHLYYISFKKKLFIKKKKKLFMNKFIKSTFLKKIKLKNLQNFINYSIKRQQKRLNYNILKHNLYIKKLKYFTYINKTKMKKKKLKNKKISIYSNKLRPYYSNLVFKRFKSTISNIKNNLYIHANNKKNNIKKKIMYYLFNKLKKMNPIKNEKLKYNKSKKFNNMFIKKILNNRFNELKEIKKYYLLKTLYQFYKKKKFHNLKKSSLITYILKKNYISFQKFKRMKLKKSIIMSTILKLNNILKSNKKQKKKLKKWIKIKYLLKLINTNKFSNNLSLKKKILKLKTLLKLKKIKEQKKINLKLNKLKNKSLKYTKLSFLKNYNKNIYLKNFILKKNKKKKLNKIKYLKSKSKYLSNPIYVLPKDKNDKKLFLNATKQYVITHVISTGIAKFKGAKRSYAYAAQVIAIILGLKLKKKYKKLKGIHIRFKGRNYNRKKTLKALLLGLGKKIRIWSMKDVTPKPHNGCRKKSMRRIKKRTSKK